MQVGASTVPYFLKSDLPQNTEERDKTLLAVMGSPDIRQIDGLGGADPVKSKVAIISKSEEKDVDVNYYFAQVKIDEPIVDTKPSCGNMLIGVGPFSIEKNLVQAQEKELYYILVKAYSMEWMLHHVSGTLNNQTANHLQKSMDYFTAKHIEIELLTGLYRKALVIYNEYFFIQKTEEAKTQTLEIVQHQLLSDYLKLSTDQSKMIYCEIMSIHCTNKYEMKPKLLLLITIVAMVVAQWSGNLRQ